jgi:ABC-type hemin transport system substrate-binding protein
MASAEAPETFNAQLYARVTDAGERVSDVVIDFGEAYKVSGVDVDTFTVHASANINDIRHKRAANTQNIYSCNLTIEMETRDFSHGEEIIDKLEKLGIKVLNNNY